MPLRLCVFAVKIIVLIFYLGNMKSTETEIANEYKKMIKHLEREVGRSGVIKSVDEAAQTALVQLTIHDQDETVHVVLNATPESDMGINIYPAVDSDVVVCDVDGDGIYTIIQYGKIDKVIVKTGDDAAELEITTGTVKMNGGENGGLTITPTLQEELNKVKTLLTHIVGVINAMPMVAEAGSGAPSGLQGAIKAAIASDSLPNFDNIENVNVQH